MKLKSMLLTVASLGLAFGSAQAANTISINFAQGPNQAFTGGSNIGPLATNSANWNNTIVRDSGTLAAGTITNLIEDVGGVGVATTAGVTWAANGLYFNNIGNTTDQQKLGVGYLDDGPTTAISISFTNIPYTQYQVYGLFASDKANPAGAQTLALLDFDINSGTWVIGGAAANNTAAAYGSITDNALANGGADWSPISAGGTGGNYFQSGTLTGSSLTIDGQVGNGSTNTRGSLAGIVIAQVPEPSAALLGAFGLLGLLRRRRA